MEFTAPPKSPHRPVRSFVRREGRFTAAQQRALKELWPGRGIDHPGPKLDFPELFGNDHPVELEIGCGDGEALAAMALQRPRHNFIGVEVYRPGVGKLLQNLEQQQSDNVRLLNADAVEVVTSRIPLNSLYRIMVFFPDPWPKKKHHKRRLLNTSFIEALRDRLHTDGELHMATDWEDYAESILEQLQAVQGLHNTAGQNGTQDRPAHRPETKYERRGVRLGHGVWDIILKRQ